MLRGWRTACYANRCEGREDLRMGKNGRVYRKIKHNNKDIICLCVSKKLSTFVATRKGYMSKEMTRFDGLYNEVREIIAKAKQNAIRSVDFSRVEMYWKIGRRIQEEEQKGKERADYGTYLLKNLAKKLEPEYGSGFSVRQLEMCRQFYRVYPIANTVCAQLNWSQYKLLISIPDEYKREYYQLEAINNCWTKRELERQINSQLYERLLLSNDKENVLAIARKERIPQAPQEIIKDPAL